MNHLSVVIPVQNESTLVNELLSRVRLNVEKITNDFKIIIVDDGSIDDTWILIKEFVKSDNRVMGIRLSRNFGQHFAITAGIHTTDSEWVVVMDGDLQKLFLSLDKIDQSICLTGSFREFSIGF
jgi:dolichol-phosphate mannosyltransferase